MHKSYRTIFGNTAVGSDAVVGRNSATALLIIHCTFHAIHIGNGCKPNCRAFMGTLVLF